MAKETKVVIGCPCGATNSESRVLDTGDVVSARCGCGRIVRGVVEGRDIRITERRQ